MTQESPIQNYYLPFGILTSLVTIAQIFLLFITIIGIPVALVLAKSLPTYFNPVGKICVDSEFADELKRQRARDRVSKMVTD